jgi:UPF0755 protein
MGSMSVDQRGSGASGAPGGSEWQHDPWDDPDITDALVVEPARRSSLALHGLLYAVLAVSLVAVLVAGSVGWWYINEINPKGDPGAAVNFTVNQGETVESLSRRLQREGFITNARVFRWYAERQGGLELEPGYYALRPRDHMGNLMRVLRTPPEQTFSSVTFPEGYTVAKMGDRLTQKIPRIRAEDFVAAAKDGSVASPFLPEGTTDLEGLLFPDTYQVANSETATQVVQRMATLMERVGRQENIVARGYEQGLTAYQVLIIASMVEREAKVDADRPLIARVILNRWRRQMPLQIDATLFYGQSPDLPFSVLKEIDSPYNTYRYVGLPPTPIANPGRASIAAVVNPATNPPAGGADCKNIDKADCEWLYYVLADSDGGHAFAVTLQQHEANVEKARAAGLL